MSYGKAKAKVESKVTFGAKTAVTTSHFWLLVATDLFLTASVVPITFLHPHTGVHWCHGLHHHLSRKNAVLANLVKGQSFVPIRNVTCLEKNLGFGYSPGARPGKDGMRRIPVRHAPS